LHAHKKARADGPPWPCRPNDLEPLMRTLGKISVVAQRHSSSTLISMLFGALLTVDLVARHFAA